MVQATQKIKILKCGLFLHRLFPIFGASPDGISKDYVIELKCPFKDKTVTTYIKNGQVTKRYLAQMQLQMLFAKKRKGLFCVAAPDFESSEKVDIIEVEFDPDFCDDLIEKALCFWRSDIFPLIVKNK